MKILCLNGSPRLNGNTKVALKTLAELVTAKAPAAEVSLVDLGTMALRPFTEEGCAIKGDDTERLLDQAVEADVLVLGTPVYWWGMSAQLKMLIDNFEMRVKELKAKPKKVVVISVGASPVDNVQYGLIKNQCQCIADFLRWNLVDAVAFSAFGAGDLAKQAGLQERLKATVDQVL